MMLNTVIDVIVALTLLTVGVTDWQFYVVLIATVLF